MPKQPPPPPRKRELYATVQLADSDELQLLPVREIGDGGVTLAGRTLQIKQFPVGARQDLLVFDALDARAEPLRARAEVAAQGTHGVALRWQRDTPDVDKKLERMLRSLRGARRK